ncbi:MAG: ABC transporter substrate-binding protein [Puniceicoccales bacterium]|nr:ABC transporter substrate-binding protein [Puniceicoccales bacterium]
MRKYICGLIFALSVFCGGCGSENGSETIRFGTCADYPPFEYYKNGVLVGFEVDLVKIIAERLGKKAVFEDMAFSTLLTSLNNGFIDAVISGYGSSQEKREKYGITFVYYPEKLVFVYKEPNSITSKDQLARKKVAYQLGIPGMKKWLRENIPDAEPVLMDRMELAVESLKAGHVDCIIIDEFVANVFCEKNPGLKCFVPDCLKISDGLAIVTRKNASLKEEINKILKTLETTGELQKLKEKWGLKEKWKLLEK